MQDQSTPIINQYVGLIETEPFENSIGVIEDLAQLIISDLNLIVVKKLSHLFSPKGITLVYILSESHLAIHTWPELGMIHIDLVICSLLTQMEFENSLTYALTNYNPYSVEVKSVSFDKL